MALSELAVRRRVTTLMVFAGVMLLGAISWTRLPQELFPSLTYPELTVITNYQNAAPEEIETLITKIIEESVGTVPRLKRISSVSKEGTSLVLTEFEWGTNMDFASLAVREKIDLIKERLPIESEEPIVVKYNPFELPVMVLSVTGERTPAELLAYTKKFIKDELEKIDGVASASISGGVDREIQVEVDQARLQAHGISLLKVAEILKRSNINYPAGTIEERFYEYLIRTIGEFEVVPEVGALVVGVREPEKPEQEGAAPAAAEEEPLLLTPRFVRLSDIATVRDATKEPTSISRYNGRENLSIALQKQAAANTIQVVERVRKALGRLTQQLPSDIRMEVIYDQSRFIRQSIDDVRDAAVQGGVLVFIILLVFLRSVRIALITTLAFPISLTAALTLMYFNGMSMNMMSLMGLALGIGDVADGAIVVIDHASALREDRGLTQRQAAIVGANEMSSAIAAARFTTISVFLPTIFVIGIAGQLFKEMALTVSFSLLASMAVAITIVPSLLAGRHRDETSGAAPAPSVAPSAAAPRADFLSRCEAGYGRLLAIGCRQPWLPLVAVLGLFLGSLLLFTDIEREFMPRIDEGQFIVKVTMPSGTRLQTTNQVVQRVEEALRQVPEVRNVSVSIGSSKESALGQAVETQGAHQGQVIVELEPRRRRSTTAVIQDLKARLEREPLEGAQVDYVVRESLFASAVQGAAPIVVEVKGNDARLLAQTADRVFERVAAVPGVYGVRRSVAMPQPEVKINVLKDRASLYHVSLQDIALTAHAGIKGVTPTKFKEQGREVDITVRLRPEDREDLTRLRGLLVESPMGQPVPLSEVAFIARGVGPSEIRRLDQQRVIMISANIAGRSLNAVVTDVEGVLAEINNQLRRLNPQQPVVAGIGGEREQMRESFRSLQFAMLLAVLLVYMIMASEFESFWQPFIIMFTVPLAVIGVAWTLWITGTSMNVVVLLGMIMLAGTVVSNGIVLVDSVNAERAAAQHILPRVPLEEVVVTASRTRLRPILMTSLTTILGALPIAFSKTLMASLALAVMGGMAFSMVLTLGVIPLLYLLVARRLAPIRLVMPEPAEMMAPALAVPGVGTMVMPPPPAVRVGPRPTGVEPEPTPVEESSSLEPPAVPKVPKMVSEVHPLAEIPTLPPMVFPPRPPMPEVAAEPSTPPPPDVPPPPVAPPPPPAPPEAAPAPAVDEEETPLNRRQERLLEHLRQVKRITRKEYAEVFGISVPTAARDLKELLDRKRIRARGPLGPGRWYEPMP